MTDHSIPMRGQLADVPTREGLPGGLEERCLDPGDSAVLGQLMAAAYRGTVDDHGEDDLWHQDEAVRTLRGHFGAPVFAASFLAVQDERLIGTCLVTEEPQLLLAFALVLPEWQNLGIGTTLIAHSAQALISTGYQEWTLAVTDGSPARHLYERLGFVHDESLR